MVRRLVPRRLPTARGGAVTLHRVPRPVPQPRAVLARLQRPGAGAWPRTADVPLLERAKFLAIFSQNLDEFFQVRVAGLKDQVAAGVGTTTPDGRTPAEQLAEIRERVR